MRSLASLLFLLTCCNIQAQSVLSKETNCAGSKISYAKRAADSTANHLVVGLLDKENKTWNPVTWCSMLDQITHAPEAIILVPGAELTQEQLVCLLERYEDSVHLGNLQFISLGSGAQTGTELVKNGYSGLFISPRVLPTRIASAVESAYVISKTDEGNTVGFLNDSLTRDGHWVKLESHPASDIFYIDNFKREYRKMYEWVDSVQTSIRDTNRVLASSKASVRLPEVIRQGTSIEIDVFMARQGVLKCRIQSLSAEEVYSNEQYFGRGKHRFEINTSSVNWGVYTLVIEFDGFIEKHKFMIRG